MKTNLYYFTGTGNSLKAAKDLAELIRDCKIIPIVSAFNKKQFEDTSERIGFIFPLYYLSYPKVVGDFLKKLKFLKAEYIFAVITRGFNPMGGVIKDLRKIIKAKGKILNSAFYADMPNNDVMLFDIPSDEKKNILLAKCKKQLEKAGTIIKNKQKHYDFEPFRFLRPIRYPVYLKEISLAKQKFHFTSECNGCGICAKLCPFGNIIIDNNVPVWNNSCQLCEGCINICPKKAIQHGNATVKKGRYKHPDISINEIIEQKNN